MIPGDTPDEAIRRLDTGDRAGSFNGGVPAIDVGRTAYPRLRRAISEHLRDVCEFVHLGQADAARVSLASAMAIHAEIYVDAAETSR